MRRHAGRDRKRKVADLLRRLGGRSRTTADAPLAVSMAKAAASDAGRKVCAAGIQLHGGIGMTWEHDLQLYSEARQGRRGRLRRRHLAPRARRPADGIVGAVEWPTRRRNQRQRPTMRRISRAIPANFAALTPLGFLARAAAVYPDKLAVIHGDAALHLPRVLRALPPLRRCAAAARHRPRRHGRGDGAERAGAARSALRRADGRGGAERAQLSGSTPRSIAFILEHGERQGADRRPRIRPGRRRGAARSSAATCRS